MKANWNEYYVKPRAFEPASFRTTDTQMGPVYSWVWDAPVTEEIIRSQIDDMADAGIRTFYVIPEPPEFRPANMITTMTPDYLGPEFFELIKLAVSYGNSKGMEVWVYDEGGWPSGSACGQVVAKRPDLAAKKLTGRTVELPAGTAYVPGEGTLASFIDKKRVFAGEVFADTVEITEYFRLMGGRMPDLTEWDTAKVFMELTHERYQKAFDELGDHYVPCLFTDEPLNAMPVFPYDFPEVFEKEYGYSILDYLYVFEHKNNPMVFDRDDLNEQEKKARSDYGILVGKLLAERCYGPMQEWCRAHGFILTGHLDRDHMIDRYVAAYGNPMKILRTLDMPGIDVILRQIYPKENPILEGQGFFPRLAPSAAAQTGHLLSISETFGVYGNEVTYDQMRWITNYQLVRGVQVLNPMIIPLGRDGALGYGERPYFCKEMPGYYHLKQFNENIGRTTYFMSCGLPALDNALFLPVEEIWEDQKFVQAYHELGDKLESENIDFDIIDKEAILSGEVIDGALHVGHAVYKKIWLPEGVVPTGKLAEILSQLSGETDTPACSDNNKLKIRVRKFEDELYIMAFAEDIVPVSGTVTIDSGKACYKADPETGKLWKLCDASESGKQEIRVSLVPGEALLILVTDKAYDAETALPLSGTVAAKLTACTQVAELIADEKGIRRDTTVKELAVAESFAELVGKEFSGEICYRLTLELSETDIAHKRFVLRADGLQHSADVKVNGKEAGIIAVKPYVLEICSCLLKAGENVLELTVGNTGANRYGATDTSVWFESKYTGPYHPQEQNFERERQDGGLFGAVVLELY